MAGPSPPQAGPLKGIFLISTASTGQGWVLDNNLPVMISYSGYKTPTGEYTYEETVDHLPVIAVEEHGCLIGENKLSTKIAAWQKIGFNPDIATVEEPVNWSGTLFWAATTGQPMSVVSNNNLDKSGSSGCAQVYVKYLGRDYLEYSTIVSLNGTTAVALVDTSIARIQNFQAYSGNAALGTIVIGPSTGGTTITSIAPGLTRARNSMWTVPSSKTLFVKNLYYSAVGDAKTGIATRILLRTNYNDTFGVYSTSLFWVVSASLLKDSAVFQELHVPLRIPEKTDLYTVAISGAASTGNMVETVLRGWTVEN
jgi:hypothetical protein